MKIDIKDKIIKAFLKNSSYQFATTIIASGAGFAQAIILARYLGVDSYGLLALVMTCAQFITQFVSCNMWEIVIKYGGDFYTNKRREEYLATVKLGYYADVISGMLTLILVIAAARPAAHYVFHTPSLEYYIYLYSILTFFSFLDNTSNGVLRIHSRFGLIAIRDTVSALIRLLLLWLVLILGYGLEAVIICFILVCVAQTIVNISITFSELQCSPIHLLRSVRLLILKSYRTDIYKFALNNYFSQSWSMVIANIDTILLGYFRSPTDVGIYRMAKNFYNVLTRVIDPFYVVIYPDLVKSWAAENYSTFKSLIFRGTAILLSLVTPIVLIVFFAIEFILRVTVGDSYAEAATPTRLIIFGAWLAAAFFWARPAILSMGKANVPAVVNFFNMLILITVSILIVPLYGAAGSAAVYCLPIVLGNVAVSSSVYLNFRRHAIS